MWFGFMMLIDVLCIFDVFFVFFEFRFRGGLEEGYVLVLVEFLFVKWLRKEEF